MTNDLNDSTGIGTTPADLQAARDGVVKLVDCLHQTVNCFSDSGGSAPAVLSATGRKQIPEVVKKLGQRISSAESQLAPVPSELTVASGHILAVHEAVIKFARNFLASTVSLTVEGVTPDPDTIQRWLARARQSVEGYMLGVTRDARFGDRGSGIDFEMKRAAALRVAKNPRQTRVRCESTDRSVWLDGNRIASGLGEEMFAYFEVLVAHYPDPITFKKIEKQASLLSGVNQTRLKDALPRAIAKLIIRGWKGHALKLPD